MELKDQNKGKLRFPNGLPIVRLFSPVLLSVLNSNQQSLPERKFYLVCLELKKQPIPEMKRQMGQYRMQEG